MTDQVRPSEWSFAALGKCIREDPAGWKQLRSQHPDWRPDIYCQDFSGCDLTGYNFKSCILYDCNFSKARLCGADLSDCIANRASFRGALLADCSLERASLQAATLNFADLSRANLTGASLYGASLQGAILVDSCLKSADLRYVLFSGHEGLIPADVTGAYLQGATLMTAADGGANTMRQAERIRAISPEFKETFSGPDYVSGSILELTTARGLESAHFDRPTGLIDYIEEAFRYILDLGKVALETSPEDVAASLIRIQYIKRLYSQLGRPPESLVLASNTATQELIDYLACHPKELYTLKPRQFEELIAEVLSSFGWRVELTKATRDGGYDIFAVSSTAAGLSTSWIIECKKYSERNKVGLSLVRSLYGIKADMRVANALLATTSTFTQDASSYAAGRYDLHLRDFNQIVAWLRSKRGRQ